MAQVKPAVVESVPTCLQTTTTVLSVGKNANQEKPVATESASTSLLIPATVVNVPTNAAPMLVVAESV